MSRTKQAARKNGPKPTKNQSKEKQTKSEDNGEVKSNNIKANRPLLQLNKCKNFYFRTNDLLKYLINFYQ